MTTVVLIVLVLLTAIEITVSGAPPDVPETYADRIEQRVNRAKEVIEEGPYQATFDDLSTVNHTPEWFKDGKLGIFFHWGLASVPAFRDFLYGERMYIPGSRVHKHHLKHYGAPDEFTYAEFVPLFRAQQFDADRWTKRFQEAGARFVAPVTEHHDGFSMWDSEVNPWNAADRGPERDLTGELANAIRKRNMKFVPTFHHAHLWLRKTGKKWKGFFKGAGKHYPSVLEDPLQRMMYGYMSRKQFEEYWLAKLVEVVERYEPDMVWLDSWLDDIPEEKQAQFAAYYYSKGREWGKTVGITRKQDDLPLNFSIQDYEKGRPNRLEEDWWLSHDTINQKSWYFTRGWNVRSTRRVLHDFIDVVSKKGVYLLNITPMANGIIPAAQRRVLRRLGNWLDTNGEAIYGTRPWETFGEGPTRLKRGGGFLGTVTYTSSDLRYTQSKDGDALYVIALGWPGDTLSPGRLRVKSDHNGSVRMLGHKVALEYEVSNGRLNVDVPELSTDERPGKYAYAFKLTGFDLQSVDPYNRSVSTGKPATASNVYKD